MRCPASRAQFCIGVSVGFSADDTWKTCSNACKKSCMNNFKVSSRAVKTSISHLPILRCTLRDGGVGVGFTEKSFP